MVRFLSVCRTFVSIDLISAIREYYIYDTANRQGHGDIPPPQSWQEATAGVKSFLSVCLNLSMYGFLHLLYQF